MYAETDLMFPYFQSFSQEVQQLEEFCRSNQSNVSMSNLVQTSTISEYDLGGEGDLFKAPEPIMEDAELGFDPITAAISMISCAEDVISPQTLEAADITAMQDEQLLSEMFYECRKDIMAKDAIETSLSDVLDMKIPAVGAEAVAEEKLFTDGSFSKSVSSGCLSSMEWVQGAPMRPNFLDFPGMDFSTVYGMRRAFSEGDIKTLDNTNSTHVHSPTGLPPHFIGNSYSEERKQQLSRYRNKKTKRNFGRKIKYACRKALADSQPRVRGRFAKTEEPHEVCKKN